MAINTLEYAKIFMDVLDKQIVAEATTGWMEDNAGQVKYSGGNEVKIPILSMSGLGNYDKDKGFVQGSITLEYQTKTLTQDRGSTFHIDAVDVDETGLMDLVGNAIGEFQRTRVIPELDAYRYSSIATQAMAAGKKTEYSPSDDDIFERLKEDISTLQEISGSNSQFLIIMSISAAVKLDLSQGMTRILDTINFQQGGINTLVKSFDGNPIIKVPSNRMKTLYIFNDGSTSGQKHGGFEVAAGAKNINWIITVRNAPIAISKTDVPRLFDPMTNQLAHAWKIDYRKYHDIWITENALDGVWVNIEP